jgi:hypothetical protein
MDEVKIRVMVEFELYPSESSEYLQTEDQLKRSLAIELDGLMADGLWWEFVEPIPYTLTDKGINAAR